MTAPLVSVVMSVFNGERFLAEAVGSILAQSFHDFEFIIIDDGSTDRSAAILDCFPHSDSRLAVHHEKHAGLVSSLNRGCGLARGKYIARMDADDIACQDRLAKQVAFLEDHPEVGIAGGAVEWIDAGGNSLGVHQHPRGDREIKAALRGRCAFWHPTVLLRREVFLRAGGYRNVVVDAEDYDLWLRIADCCQVANLGAVLLKYRIHPGQVSMRKRVRQSLGILAAQAADRRRREGLPDPLNKVAEITSEALTAWGVSPTEQRRKVISDYRQWIQTMCTAGEYTTALNAALEALQEGLQDIERWQLADLHLTVAELLWRERRFLESGGSVVRAVLTRPLVVGRPLKRFLKA